MINFQYHHLEVALMSKNQILTNKIFKLNNKVVIEQFDDGGLALYLPDLQLFELNPTALHVLDKTDGVHTVSQVAQSLAKTYHTPEAEALEDVIELYMHLNEKNLVEILNEIDKE